MAGEFGDLLSLDFSGGLGGDLFGGASSEVTPGELGGAGFEAPTQPAPTPTPGTGFSDIAGGIKSGLQPFADVAKAALPLVGLGTAGVGMAAGIQGAQTSAQQARLARQAQGMQKQTLQAQQAAAAPLTAFGSQELQQAGAGNIPPAIQAKIDAWATGAKAKARDFAARSGQGDSTMLTQWESWIDQQAQAMAADYLQQQQQLGVQSLSQGAQALAGAGQNAASLQAGATGQEAGIARLMDEANRALASLSAGAA